MTTSEFFHDASGSVRFWVLVGDVSVGASVSKDALHFRFAPLSVGEDPLSTFRANLPCLEDAVRRRVASGSIEPVMLREADLRTVAEAVRRTE
jgi:hypothetical protein